MVAVILCLLIGSVSGILGGYFGVGGGILIVPALIWIFNMGQYLAQGTSLVALLAPVGIFAFINYYRMHYVDLYKGILIAIGFMIGAFWGSQLALHSNEHHVRKMFAVFLGIIALLTFFKK